MRKGVLDRDDKGAESGNNLERSIETNTGKTMGGGKANPSKLQN